MVKKMVHRPKMAERVRRTYAYYHIWTLKKKTKLKLDLIAHFAGLEPLEQENVESFTDDSCPQVVN